MCSTFAQVDPETLEVTLMYNTNGGDRWSPGDIECLVPFDIVSNVAVLVDGTITLVEDPTKVAAKTAQAWTALRLQRNQLLQQSDWTRLDDTSLTETQREAWRDYRQALRDVTKGLEDPANVQWPQVPN